MVMFLIAISCKWNGSGILPAGRQVLPDCPKQDAPAITVEKSTPEGVSLTCLQAGERAFRGSI